MTLKSFYELLFDPEQATCFTISPKGTRVLRVMPQTTYNYFSVNALDPARDRDPSEIYHSTDKPRRADHNVVCFRNILIEMDSGTLGEQLALLPSTGIPWSTCVWSGGKSMHFIISLREPLADRAEYSTLVKRVYGALSRHMNIDQANKNPSRLSRCPEVRRAEKGTVQSLISVLERVDRSDLESWLIANNEPTENFSDAFSAQASFAELFFFPETKTLSGATKRFLASGAPQGEWNHGLFRAACDLFANGYSHEEATRMLGAITGTLDASDVATIRSAYKRAFRSLPGASY